jgi:rhodanese-related sulfurtransferase
MYNPHLYYKGLEKWDDYILSSNYITIKNSIMINLLKNLFNKEKTDFATLVKEGAIIIDVRTVGEFKEGHIRGSRNIPLDSIQNKLAEIKRLNKPVITVCRSGARSNMARSILASGGVTVYNGGAWRNLENLIK